MRILFVTNDVPFPPDNGVRIVSHYAMRLMRARGHSLSLAVLTEQDAGVDVRLDMARTLCESREAAWWRPLGKRSRLEVLAAAMLRGRMYFLERYRDAAFRARLRATIESFRPDVVHFDTIAMTQYRDVVPDGVGTVASINDSWPLTLESRRDTPGQPMARRLYRMLERRLARAYERRCYAAFGKVHVVSSVDAAYLRALSDAIDVSVVPNGVDEDVLRASGGAQRPEVVFVGKLAPDNTEYLARFIDEGWPVVQAAHPHAVLKVVGAIDPACEARLQRAARQPGVELCGYVPRLVDAYAGRTVAVVPVDKRCGLVNKALEGMAASLAVVGFDETFAGLPEAKKGVHFESGASNREIGARIAALLSNPARAAQLGAAGRLLVSQRYAWATRAEAFESLYSAAAAKARRRSSAAVRASAGEEAACER